MRQRILIVLLTFVTILTCWTWYENTFAIDFFAAKNRHSRNQKRIEIMNETNIDSVQHMAVEILENYEQRHSESDETIRKVQYLLTVTAAITFATLILAIFNIRRKAGR
jgi:hypothetical protein